LLTMQRIVTGAAGFIGHSLTKRLLDQGHEVVGIDNLNDYYDPKLKLDRLKQLQKHANFQFHQVDIEDHEKMLKIFTQSKARVVYHLAAQAGVRYSLTHPFSYQKSNLDGFLSVLECVRHIKPEHFVYASSSSVYGASEKVPFLETDPTDKPVSLYAATKKANEVMAHAYSDLYKIPMTGLRFFTVYGPFGRPDMAYFSFTQKILAEQTISVFNHGKHQRDFTYIDDIVDGILLVGENKPKRPYSIYNIGNSQPVWLMDFIETLSQIIGKKPILINAEKAAGDVPNTFANVSALQNDYGFRPTTDLKTGLTRFYDWYKNHYK
jgi:UDP-glucuronate 4-epimerase